MLRLVMVTGCEPNTVACVDSSMTAYSTDWFDTLNTVRLKGEPSVS